MANAGTSKYGRPQLRFGLKDLIFANVAVAAGTVAAVKSTWDVGGLVATFLLLAWQVRNRRYAAIPGAAIGVLFAWMILPVSVDRAQLLSLTAIGGTVGASLNALLFRYYLSGFVALFVAFAVAFIIPVVAT